MSAGLYGLTGNQTNLDTNGEFIVFNNVLHACPGVSLSGGVFTFSPGKYLVLGSFDFTRTSGSQGVVWVHMYADPSGTPEIYGMSAGVFGAAADNTSNAFCGTAGPGVTIVNAEEAVSLAVGVAPTVTWTCNSAYTWLCIINLDTAPVDFGLFTRATDQTSVDTVGEQVTWNNTLKSCTGVTLSSGEFTFTEDGLYVVLFGPQSTRASGSGQSIDYKVTTDSSGAGTTTYSTSVGCRVMTADNTSACSGNAGAAAIVNRSGSNVTIGINVSAVPGSTSFTVESDVSSVAIWRMS